MRSRLTITAAASAALAFGSAAGAGELAGAAAPLGQGTVSPYVLPDAAGAPAEIGITFSVGAFDGLPPDPDPTNRCFDLDGDGALGQGECEGDHALVLPLPDLGRADIPFRWVMLNWNPHGHAPEAWSPPHFDIHFYSAPVELVESMRPGPCGFFMHCDDFERAVRPVPAKYLHPDYIDVKAAVAGMGNHLIDSKTPELGDPPAPFTHTFIYGAYDGRIIFHEIMAVREFMAASEHTCADIKQPAAWQEAGYYPTRYCFRLSPDGATSAYLSDFVLRPAG